MQDNTYYQNLIRVLLAEFIDDEIPELPSDKELDQLKWQTALDLGKVPKWVKYTYTYVTRVDEHYVTLRIPQPTESWIEDFRIDWKFAYDYKQQGNTQSYSLSMLM